MWNESLLLSDLLLDVDLLASTRSLLPIKCFVCVSARDNNTLPGFIGALDNCSLSIFEGRNGNTQSLLKAFLPREMGSFIFKVQLKLHKAEIKHIQDFVPSVFCNVSPYMWIGVLLHSILIWFAHGASVHMDGCSS